MKSLRKFLKKINNKKRTIKFLHGNNVTKKNKFIIQTVKLILELKDLI